MLPKSALKIGLSLSASVGLLVWMGAAVSACLADDAPSATVTLDAGDVRGHVTPFIFGSNLICYQQGSYGDTGPNGTNRGEGMWDSVKKAPAVRIAQLARQAGLSIARWPGGCGVHYFQWKLTIGPLGQRPSQLFGLPEFLTLCQELKAQPLITVSDYTGASQDAADLVEYLNSPDDGHHPWAAKRTADGHKEPWKVLWFEYGNESEHGAHRGNEDAGKGPRFSADEYAHNYLKYRQAMRSVDPTIKVGAVFATGFPDLEGWPATVARVAGKQLDFVVHHSYRPSLGESDPSPEIASLFKAAYAADAQIQDYYNRMRAVLRHETGRDDIPIAVTEYNGGFVQDKPVPFRHTLGNALINASMLMVFLNPKNQIIMANFWEFPNEYWGAVRGYEELDQPLVRRPQYYPQALMHTMSEEELISCRIVSPTFDTEGGFTVEAARGPGSIFQLHGEPVLAGGDWELLPGAGFQQDQEDGVVHTVFGGQDINYYHARKLVPAQPGVWYRFTGEVKTAMLSSLNGACFQIGDSRGWPATKSAAITPSITGTSDWTRVTADYLTLKDTSALEIIARRLEGGGPVSGQAWYRNTQLQRFTPHTFPATPVLATVASRTISGNQSHLTMILLNKQLDKPLKVVIQLKHFTPRTAATSTLSGPALESTNETDPNTVSVKEQSLGSVKNGFSLILPPHSLTRLRVEGSLSAAQ